MWTGRDEFIEPGWGGGEPVTAVEEGIGEMYEIIVGGVACRSGVVDNETSDEENEKEKCFFHNEACMQFSNFLMLLLGFGFTLFVPGFVVVETFFRDLPGRVKLPLVVVLSVLVSTGTVFGAALLLGLNKGTILLVFAGYYLWLVGWWARGWSGRGEMKIDWWQAGIGVGVYVVFWAALFPGIFTFYKGAYVLSSVNWQDTAMHLGIIESLVQGNFPPEAPYFSGRALEYYYFSDLHAAVLNILYGEYFPRVVVYVNPVFVGAFAMGIYALSVEVYNRRRAAVLAAVMGVFSGNMMFVRLAGDAVKMGGMGWDGVVRLVARGGYTMEEELMQMVPAADYFLQNRPAMVGLATIPLVMCLVLVPKRRARNVALAGVMVGMMAKFQLFAMVVGLGVLAVGAVVRMWGNWKREAAIGAGSVAIAMAAAVVMSWGGGEATLRTMGEGFEGGAGEEGKSWGWLALFWMCNLGLGVVAVVMVVWRFLRRKMRGEEVFLVLVMVGLAAVPHMVRFKLYRYDMFKFFYYMMIPAVVIVGRMLDEWWQWWWGKVAVVGLLGVSFLTSVILLWGSYLNKNIAYRRSEYEVGEWIRNNTPGRSIFLEMPEVHSPVTQIGGRLRVLSYITWPYSHGFNAGEDNVFSRLVDVEAFYASGDEQAVIRMREKYGVDYVYVGESERGSYPEVEGALEENGLVRKVYEREGEVVYEVVYEAGEER